ncbi:uncharacterized protein HMPREF1541_01856 [Cyphellophora europaea CBS 101466]|uniref:GP-PDE domain-containing protein n=1 Tax=Cyphellophora europaea (strain CBS 101466) TaxID=1220924 RepID=W2S3S6_CYPE1|nr:uncharacterized protein HMPREF1541_01856 [Cyphellophora europaea CBS 101466]ETN42698.1 hypothetical protein HMPREF1541_01856 [Cyphellophora europaea CBS 101466]
MRTANLAVLISSLAPLVLAAQQPYDVHKIIDAFRRPHEDLTILCAHRGLRWNGTADNSYDAYYRASEAGLECIETDIRVSSDGYLPMIHDSGLGRETNVGEVEGQAAYNPFTGQGHNPKVEDSAYSGFIEDLHLRDEAGRVRGETVPTLPGMVQYIHDVGMNVVLQLDFKDEAGVEIAYWQLKNLTNAAGVPANEWCIYKLQANWYRTPEEFEALAWVQDAFASGIQLAYIPVYNSGDMEEWDVLASMKAFAKTNYTISAEINMKSTDGPLRPLKDWVEDEASDDAAFRTSGIFFAIGDFVDPITSPRTYFDTANYTLPDDIRTNNSAFSYQDGRAPRLYDAMVSEDESPDGHDYRTDFGWIIGNAFDWVIADATDELAAMLAMDGKRNVQHLLAKGEAAADEQLALGWYKKARRRAREFQ